MCFLIADVFLRFLRAWFLLVDVFRPTGLSFIVMIAGAFRTEDLSCALVVSGASFPFVLSCTVRTRCCGRFYPCCFFVRSCAVIVSGTSRPVCISCAVAVAGKSHPVGILCDRALYLFLARLSLLVFRAQ